MDNTRFQRAEEARRQAMANMIEAKQRENDALRERAAVFAVETQKVGNLRALRLAREAADKLAAGEELAKPAPTRKILAA